MAINKPFKFFDRATGDVIKGVTVVTYDLKGFEVDRGVSNSVGVAHTTSDVDDRVVFSYPGKKTITQRYGSAYTKQYMVNNPDYVAAQPENTISTPDASDTNNSSETTNTVNIMTKQFIVKDEFGSPISGAHVYTSSTNGTITDTSGKATLNVQAGDSIIFSHLSYKAQQYPVSNVPGTITLSTNVNAMDEVVITAPKKKTNWFKPVGVGLAFMLLISMGNKPKKATL